jgi:hypothetical protein
VSPEQLACHSLPVTHPSLSLPAQLAFPCQWPGLFKCWKEQGAVLFYSRFLLNSHSCGWESFIYICKLSEFDMEVTKREHIWNIEMPFLQPHF